MRGSLLALVCIALLANCGNGETHVFPDHDWQTSSPASQASMSESCERRWNTCGRKRAVWGDIPRGAVSESVWNEFFARLGPSVEP